MACEAGLGMAWPGEAWQIMAGMAGLGEAWRGSADHGRHGFYVSRLRRSYSKLPTSVEGKRNGKVRTEAD